VVQEQQRMQGARGWKQRRRRRAYHSEGGSGRSSGEDLQVPSRSAEEGRKGGRWRELDDEVSAGQDLTLYCREAEPWRRGD
jgi:hypothetical protein